MSRVACVGEPNGRRYLPYGHFCARERDVMVRETTAVRPLVGKVRGGMSAPIVVECLDQEEFVLKAARPDWPQALKNEFVGGRLLEELNLPIPEMALIRVGPEVAASIQVLRGQPTPPGLYFGLEYRVGSIPLDSGLGRVLAPADIENQSALPGVHVFDTWARNGDRHEGNVLVQPTGVSSPPFRAWLIDHGFVTGTPDWTPEHLETSRHVMIKVMCPGLVQRSIDDGTDSTAWMDRVDMIPGDLIAKIPREAPAEWSFTDPEARAIAQFFVERRPLTRQFLFPQTGTQNPGSVVS